MTLHVERPISSPPTAIPAALEVAPAARAWPVRWLVMLVITYAVTGIIAIRSTIDPDVWWHLRTAIWITEHKAVPFTDPFSLYGMNRPWIAYSWLFELILLGLYRLFGLIGIIGYAVLGTLGIAVALHSLIARYEKRVPRALDDAIAKSYPAPAAAAAEDRRYTGLLFNHYGWGGYLIWRLPSHSVSRMAVRTWSRPDKIRRSAET